MTYEITLLPGDGIGPEVTEATLRVLRELPVEFNWDRHQIIGEQAVEEKRPALPDDVVESIKQTSTALKGPITTPVGGGFTSVNVQLRQTMDLYANIRPCRSLPGVEQRFGEVDLVIFRENTEGLYSSIENYDERLEIADSIKRITRKGSERIARACFEWARRNDREKVTAVHKANILKQSSGMFLKIARDIAGEYPEVEFDECIIDNMCMQLVQRPEEYDCIVTTNLFGDILSDLSAALVGGLGVVPGANIGDEYAVFEAVHGSAPDIAGEGIANPTAMIRSAAMMLDHLGEQESAQAIESAVEEIYRDRTGLTTDMGGESSTMEFADQLADRIKIP